MSAIGLAIFGVCLLIAGYLLGIWIVWVLGVICLVAGVLFLIFGSFAGVHAGRRPY